MPEFIVYACPTGVLAEQLANYFEKSLARCGANAAHRYMPHCTLTGFFHDNGASVSLYVEALESSLSEGLSHRPNSPIAVKGMTFRSDWHGLELTSEWLKAVVADFARRAESPTRQEPLRLKSWLHLSLAYEFAPEQHATLEDLARMTVNPLASVNWELHFYQRDEPQSWVCHRAWTL